MLGTDYREVTAWNHCQLWKIDSYESGNFVIYLYLTYVMEYSPQFLNRHGIREYIDSLHTPSRHKKFQMQVGVFLVYSEPSLPWEVPILGGILGNLSLPWKVPILGGGSFDKLRTEVLKCSIRSSNSEGWAFLVSSELKSLSLPWKVPILGGGILGMLRTKVPKSSLRSSNSWSDILGNHRTEFPKSSMRSSNSGGRYI